jgi:hypothetical protein
MRRHSRNLLLIAALCWVAPASAEFTNPDEGECHAGESQTVVVLADTAPGDVPVSAGRRALLP